MCRSHEGGRIQSLGTPFLKSCKQSSDLEGDMIYAKLDSPTLGDVLLDVMLSLEQRLMVTLWCRASLGWVERAQCPPCLKHLV